MTSVSLVAIDVPKTLAGSADVETSLGVFIWAMGGKPLLFSTVAKELVAVLDLSKDKDVCFITSLEYSNLPALVFCLGSINVGETISEETVPRVFISFVVVLRGEEVFKRHLLLSENVGYTVVLTSNAGVLARLPNPAN